MARPKAFDEEQALDAAIEVFRESGYEGTSAEMLVRAMGIGRQSLYDTFGDKWQLYLAAMRRYVTAQASEHIRALRGERRAIKGLTSMVERVVATADEACLGVNSICEFGKRKSELTAIHATARRAIRSAIVVRLEEAQADEDLAADLAPAEMADFLMASFATIQIAARGGANSRQLRTLGRLALRALK